MANIKSQIKRNRQNERRNDRNKAVRSALKTAEKKARAATSGEDAAAAVSLARGASRDIDRAAAKGVLHKRTAARRKSRLAKATSGSARTAD